MTAVPAMWVLNGRKGEWIRYGCRSTLPNPAARITPVEVTFARAPLEQPGPRSTQEPLRGARPRPGLGHDVLGEAEPAPWSQDPPDLGQDRLRVADAAQHQAGDDGIDAGIGQVHLLGDDAADLEVDALGARRLAQAGVHVAVRLDGDQPGAGRQVAQVGADPRAELHHGVRQVGEDRGLVLSHVAVEVAAHEPEEGGVEASEDRVVKMCRHGSSVSAPSGCRQQWKHRTFRPRSPAPGQGR